MMLEVLPSIVVIVPFEWTASTTPTWSMPEMDPPPDQSKKTMSPARMPPRP
jgi:hypothetical protein